MQQSRTYNFLRAQIDNLVATNDREAAIRYIECGYLPFVVPQMFGQEDGLIVLGNCPESKPIKNGITVLEQCEYEARNHISGGFVSCGQVNDNH